MQVFLDDFGGCISYVDENVAIWKTILIRFKRWLFLFGWRNSKIRNIHTLPWISAWSDWFISEMIAYFQPFLIHSLKYTHNGIFWGFFGHAHCRMSSSPILRIQKWNRNFFGLDLLRSNKDSKTWCMMNQQELVTECAQKNTILTQFNDEILITVSHIVCTML